MQAGNRAHPVSERPLHGPLQSSNLDQEIAHLRQEKAWQQGQRNAITLRKGRGLNVVLFVMRSGDRLEEHAAPGPISLSVREGRVRFTTEEAAVEAGPETLLTGILRGLVEAPGQLPVWGTLAVTTTAVTALLLANVRGEWRQRI